MAEYDFRDLLPRAAAACAAVIDRVAGPAWYRPTPCTEWIVRDVVNHLTAEHLWAPRLLAGETVEQVGDAYDGDLVGDDPAAAFHQALDESMRAWAAADPDGQVDTSTQGQLPVGEYAYQMLVDLTVHAWDIAKGADVAVTYDPEAVEACLAYEEPRVADGGVDGLFAAPVETDSDDPLDRLVALLGRMAD